MIRIIIIIIIIIVSIVLIDVFDSKKTNSNTESFTTKNKSDRSQIISDNNSPYNFFNQSIYESIPYTDEDYENSKPISRDRMIRKLRNYENPIRPRPSILS